MIYGYGVSLRGPYHIKNDIVCQDSHRIITTGSHIAFAAVADGLGSAVYSGEGSKIAAYVSTEYCFRHIKENTPPGNILEIIRAAFAAALKGVEIEAKKKTAPWIYMTLPSRWPC